MHEILGYLQGRFVWCYRWKDRERDMRTTKKPDQQVSNTKSGLWELFSELQGLTMHDIRGEVRKQLEESKEASADSPGTHVGIETGL